MTRAEARRRAVEAAARALCEQTGVAADDVVSGEGYTGHNPQWVYFTEEAEAAIAAYERAMSDAGWRMVRDVGERPPGNTAGQALINTGWDACRAAMLEDTDA